MPLWLKTTIATQVCAQEAPTHLYVDAIKEYHAWYATNWKAYMRCNAYASRGIYSHDMMMKCDTIIWKHHAWYAEWHNEMHECRVT